MNVYATRALGVGLQRAGTDHPTFIKAFARWKADWPLREHTSLYFGKDAFYRVPAVAGQLNRLRHAHLRPMADRTATKIWDHWFNLGKRKTSNRILVYVRDQRSDTYLLIFILEEPTAHQVASMRTASDRLFMEKLAVVAAAFLEDGRVIA